MNLHCSREFLAACEKAKNSGLAARFLVGDRVARGFADLGYEEFCMLPGNKMVSLYNGKVSDLSEDHRRFFFLVPTVEQLVQELALRGEKIEGLEFKEQRNWTMAGIESRDLDLLLLQFLQSSLECTR